MFIYYKVCNLKIIIFCFLNIGWYFFRDSFFRILDSFINISKERKFVDLNILKKKLKLSIDLSLLININFRFIRFRYRILVLLVESLFL